MGQGSKATTWRMITIAKEIRALALGLDVSFVHVGRTTNGVADFLTKNGGLLHLKKGNFVEQCA